MQQQFVGLTMPVFTAFGWAGEETAIKFALSQLEEFINQLHVNLSREAQGYFPFFGLNRESQSVYLAADGEPEQDIYIAFHARPMSFELQLVIRDRMALSKALKAAANDPERWRRLLRELGADWSLHVQQLELDEDTGETTFYQDLFKGGVEEMDAETAESVASRANFLNGEPQWLVPLYLSHRMPSERVAAMGTKVISVMSDRVGELLPLIQFYTGKVRKKTKPKSAAKPSHPLPEVSDPDNQFIYVAELKPLHLRRGFINMTPEHWDFFAQGARSTTREVTVAYGDDFDRESDVWRLETTDSARLVVSETVQEWLEDHFEPNDQIRVIASKLDDEEIEVRLEPVE